MQKSSDEGGIYDELDQLVDLMTKDKVAMSTKISQLEECVGGLQKHKNLLEAANAALRQKNYKLHQDLSSHQEQSKQVIDGLESTLEQARKEMHRGKAEGMDYIKHLEDKKDTELQNFKMQLQQKKAEVEGLMHHQEHSNAMLDELHKKVDKTKSDLCDMAAALEVQKSQNIKLAHQLSDMRKHCETLKTERDRLINSQERLQNKLESSENMLLALKGRAANTKKYEEQLKSKCSALQAALEAATTRGPSIVKVSPGPKRTREELKLREECRKKDDMIDNYSKELKACKGELMKQSLRISQMSRQMESYKRNSEDLTGAMEEIQMEKEVEVKELKQKVKKYTKELKESLTREREFDAGKEVVEKSLTRIECDLKEAKGDIECLKQEVAFKEDKWEQNKFRWEDEKIRLAKIHHEAIKSKDIVGKAIPKSGVSQTELSRELKESKENYERLKKACTRRCTELAAEVWRLKQMLSDKQDLYISFNSSDSKCTFSPSTDY